MQEEVVEDEDEPTLEIRPKVVRSNGSPASAAKTGRPKSLAEEIDELIPLKTW